METYPQNDVHPHDSSLTWETDRQQPSTLNSRYEKNKKNYIFITVRRKKYLLCPEICLLWRTLAMDDAPRLEVYEGLTGSVGAEGDGSGSAATVPASLGLSPSLESSSSSTKKDASASCASSGSSSTTSKPGTMSTSCSAGFKTTAASGFMMSEETKWPAAARVRPAFKRKQLTSARLCVACGGSKNVTRTCSDRLSNSANVSREVCVVHTSRNSTHASVSGGSWGTRSCQ